MTPRRIAAFLAYGRRLNADRQAATLSLNALAAQGKGEAIKKTIEQLQRRPDQPRKGKRSFDGKKRSRLKRRKR